MLPAALGPGAKWSRARNEAPPRGCHMERNLRRRIEAVQQHLDIGHIAHRLTGFGNCSSAINAVARASPMMNSSRPVTDAKLAFLELLMARSLWPSLGKSNSRLENRSPEGTSLPLQRFKGFGGMHDWPDSLRGQAAM
jgi:hypothetical protein